MKRVGILILNLIVKPTIESRVSRILQIDIDTCIQVIIPWYNLESKGWVTSEKEHFVVEYHENIFF